MLGHVAVERLPLDLHVRPRACKTIYVLLAGASAHPLLLARGRGIVRNPVGMSRLSTLACMPESHSLTLERGVRVLRTLAEHPEGLTVSELAAALETHRP